MELRGARVLVVGMGKTGLAVADFLLKNQARVTISETKHIDQISLIVSALKRKGVTVETGGHCAETFLQHDLIVTSPGVPLDISPLEEARAKKIEVISEIELAYRFLKTPLIAVTGTNGKTTTTSLLGEIFKTAGKRIFMGGNIGNPLIEYVSGVQDKEYVIAEISSFQLEGIKTFRPFIGVMLNLSEDHLDRYVFYDHYIAAKSRIFMNQTESDKAVINFDDELVKWLAEKMRGEILYFSKDKPIDRGAFYNGAVQFRYGGVEDKFSIEGLRLPVAQNIENILAAVSVGYICRLPADKIKDAILGFSGLEHRMEFVDEIEDVKFFNDSKATNVGAVVNSLEGLEPSIILIAGGKDKGGSYQPLQSLIKSKVKTLILLGEASQRMYEDLGREAPTTFVKSLKEAVHKAFTIAGHGDKVLLSPGCSSFDMFRSYEHRGLYFKDLVQNLKREHFRNTSERDE